MNSDEMQYDAARTLIFDDTESRVQLFSCDISAVHSDVAGKRQWERLKTDRFSEKCFANELVAGHEAIATLASVGRIHDSGAAEIGPFAGPRWEADLPCCRPIGIVKGPWANHRIRFAVHGNPITTIVLLFQVYNPSS